MTVLFHSFTYRSATGLVRMAHASRSSLFLHRLDSAIDAVADAVVRHEVVELPSKVQRWKNSNANKISVCSCDLSEEEVDLILSVLNDDWTVDFNKRGGQLQHYCLPGCCASSVETRAKARKALKCTIGSFFAVPLLYRWKHFDPATHFTLRNLLIHGLLRFVWEASMSSLFDEDVDLSALIDEDSADLNPATRQKVRMSKVWQLLGEPDTIVTWHSELYAERKVKKTQNQETKDFDF